MKPFTGILALALALAGAAFGEDWSYVRGVSLTELGQHVYDALEVPDQEHNAKVIGELKQLIDSLDDKKVAPEVKAFLTARLWEEDALVRDVLGGDGKGAASEIDMPWPLTRPDGHKSVKHAEVKAAIAGVMGKKLTEVRALLEKFKPQPEAQVMVARAYNRGVRHIVLSPRAYMFHPRKSEVVPATKPEDRPEERKRYLRLMKYIKSRGMTVGIRPIFFVVDSSMKAGFTETLPGGGSLYWWHGNILPENPQTWFDSLQTYFDQYLFLAKFGQAEEFTLGAELYSMTVGIEDHPWYTELKKLAEAHPANLKTQMEKFRHGFPPEWQAGLARNSFPAVKELQTSAEKYIQRYMYGFPGQWLSLLKHVKSKVPANCRLMYDINFTDDKAGHGGSEQYGGEFARWRYRIVDLADPQDPIAKQAWKNLVDFWSGLTSIGIDMYRSLATKNQAIPANHKELVDMLRVTSDRYASQLDIAFAEIEQIVKKKQPVILKEIGYRSVDKGFIDPFLYVDSDRGEVNLMHQAAAYEAILLSFWPKPNGTKRWDWLQGITFWDASVDTTKHGPRDAGFSFIKKPPAEAVLRGVWKP